MTEAQKQRNKRNASHAELGLPMLPPIRESEERYYLIKRTCLWFVIGDKVPFDKLLSKFTPLGIRELLADGYIEIIFNK